MKRYLLTILLTVFAAAGIGSYGVYGLTDPIPEFRVAVTEGDESLFDGVLFTGYYANQYGLYVEVSTQGSEYDFRRSMFKKRNRHPLEAQLGERAHAFLRGKNNTPVNFYTDEQMVVYATLETKQINSREREVAAEVEMLDLASGRRTEFRSVLEPQTEIMWPYLADVQRIGDELHLFLDVDDRYRVYVLTMEGQVVRTVNLPEEVASEKEEGEITRLAMLAANHRPQTAKGVVGIQVMTYGGPNAAEAVQKQEWIDPDQAANFVTEIGSDTLSRMDLYVYDYAEERVRPVGTVFMEDELETGRSFLNQMTDQYHHLVWANEEALRIKQISLADGSVRSMTYTAEQLGGPIEDVDLRDGKAYVLTIGSPGSEYNVTTLDLDSGEAAGRAKIGLNEKDAEDVPGMLYLRGMIFR